MRDNYTTISRNILNDIFYNIFYNLTPIGDQNIFEVDKTFRLIQDQISRLKIIHVYVLYACEKIALGVTAGSIRSGAIFDARTVTIVCSSVYLNVKLNVVIREIFKIYFSPSTGFLSRQRFVR